MPLTDDQCLNFWVEVLSCLLNCLPGRRGLDPFLKSLLSLAKISEGGTSGFNSKSTI